VKALNFHPSKLAGAALRQPRGADIRGQHVWVAVDTEGLFGGGILGVIPGASRQLHDAGSQGVTQHRSGKACAAIVEDANDITFADGARSCVERIYADRLAAVDFGGLTGGTEIELAVQTGRRLVCDQV
jgi:hypothetical protein